MAAQPRIYTVAQTKDGFLRPPTDARPIHVRHTSDSIPPPTHNVEPWKVVHRVPDLGSSSSEGSSSAAATGSIAPPLRQTSTTSSESSRDRHDATVRATARKKWRVGWDESVELNGYESDGEFTVSDHDPIVGKGGVRCEYFNRGRRRPNHRQLSPNDVRPAMRSVCPVPTPGKHRHSRSTPIDIVRPADPGPQVVFSDPTVARFPPKGLPDRLDRLSITAVKGFPMYPPPVPFGSYPPRPGTAMQGLREPAEHILTYLAAADARMPSTVRWDTGPKATAVMLNSNKARSLTRWDVDTDWRSGVTLHLREAVVEAMPLIVSRSLVFALPASGFRTLDASEVTSTGAIAWLTGTLLRTVMSALSLLRPGTRSFVFRPMFASDEAARASKAGPDGCRTLMMVDKGNDKSSAMLIFVRQPSEVGRDVMERFARSDAGWSYSNDAWAGSKDAIAANMLQAQVFDECLQHHVRYFAVTNLNNWVFGKLNPRYTRATVSSRMSRRSADPNVPQALTVWLLRAVDSARRQASEERTDTAIRRSKQPYRAPAGQHTPFPGTYFEPTRVPPVYSSELGANLMAGTSPPRTGFHAMGTGQYPSAAPDTTPASAQAKNWSSTRPFQGPVPSGEATTRQRSFSAAKPAVSSGNVSKFGAPSAWFSGVKSHIAY